MVETKELQEGIDLKKLILFLQKKIGMILLAGVAGALIGSGLYLLITGLTAGPQQYQVAYDYYVDFSDGTIEAHDYYNAYTWNDNMKRDFLLDPTMKALEQQANTAMDYFPSKEQVAASLEATCPTDVKYMTVTVTYFSPEWAKSIADACVVSLKDFGTRMPEFDSIEVINEKAAEPVPRAQFSMRAMAAGAVVGLFAYLLFFLFQYACDDSIYLPGEFEGRYNYRVLGMILKKSSKEKEKLAKYLRTELLLNLDYTIKHEKPVYICAITNLDQDKESQEQLCEAAMEACEEMNHKNLEEELKHKQSGSEEHLLSSYDFRTITFPVEERAKLDDIRKGCGVILVVPCGKKNGTMIQQVIRDFTTQDCKILGAILTEADGTFIDRYWRTLCQKD